MFKLDSKYIRTLFSFALLFLATILLGQEAKNPFDIGSRKEENIEQAIDQPVEIEPSIEVPDQEPVVNSIEIEATSPPAPAEETTTPLVNSDSDNPFDIERLQAIKKSKAPPKEKPAVESTKKSVKEKLTPKINTPVTGNFKFFLSTALIIFLTLSVALYSSYISKVYRAFINENFLKMIHRDHGTVVAIPYLFLYGLFFISLGIFLFLTFKHFNIPLFGNTFGGVLAYIGSVTGIFLLKHLLLNILGFVFPIQKEIKQYSFTIIIFSIVLGLILIPSNILIAHAPSSMTSFFIYGTFVVILLLYLFRTLRSLFIASRFITLYKFHFFMYLCTLEIAPVLILLKIVLSTTMEF